MSSETVEKVAFELSQKLQLARRQHPGATDTTSSSSYKPSLCYPECEICGGIGYFKNPNAQIGDPDFGKIETCPNAIRLNLERQLASGCLDPRIGLTAGEIPKLKWELIRDGLSDGHKARDAVMVGYAKGYGIVFLYGKSGQAKTLALKIGVATAFRDGKRSAYANMLSILDDIRTAFDEKENRQTELLRRMDWWNSLDVLAIDELDKINSTEWARERMFQLIDLRYQRAIRQEALTIIAANIENTDELDPYLRSRLEDNRFTECGMVVRLEGVDGRKMVPENWKF